MDRMMRESSLRAKMTGSVAFLLAALRALLIGAPVVFAQTSTPVAVGPATAENAAAIAPSAPAAALDPAAAIQAVVDTARTVTESINILWMLLAGLDIPEMGAPGYTTVDMRMPGGCGRLVPQTPVKHKAGV
jgi:hypothetical protein